MKKILLFIAAVLSAILFAGYFNYASAQTSSISNKDLVKKSSSNGVKSGVNMNKYITLNVVTGQDIRLDLQAGNDDTPIKIVSGANEQTITVGTSWTGFTDYHAGAATMTIYGDLDGFDCSENSTKITGIDPTHNQSLTTFYCRSNNITSLDLSYNNTLLGFCYINDNLISNITLASTYPNLKEMEIFGNSLSTEQINKIYCALPQVDPSDNANIKVYNNSEDNMYNAYVATNKSIATDKNWSVLKSNSNNAINTNGTYICGLNEEKYITLNVVEGQAISLDLQAENDATPIKIVSGDYEQTIIVGTSWTGFTDYHAGAATMTIYGDLDGFDCSENSTNITGVNLTHNPSLTGFYGSKNKITSLDLSQNTLLGFCSIIDNLISNITLASTYPNLYGMQIYGNNLSTEQINKIYCALPQVEPSDNAKILVYKDTHDGMYTPYLATNKSIATDKNWNVLNSDYFNADNTTGTYLCGLNEEKYITLNVVEGQDIRLDLKAENDDTPIKIVSGDNEQTILVGESWTDFNNYHAGAATMTIYGDLVGFDCSDNITNITGVNLTHNPSLKSFFGSKNKITSLDLSQDTLMEYCYIEYNLISNIILAETYPNLNAIAIYGNHLPTEQINKIYCALPQVEPSADAAISVYNDTYDVMYTPYLATNKSIATDKNWNVLDGNDLEAANTTGTYICGSGLNDISDNDINIYPNPAKDDIVLTNVFNEIVKIFDVNGRLVKQEIVNQRMNISDLQSGVYYLQIGNATKKIIVK